MAETNEYFGNQFLQGVSCALVEITHPSLQSPILLTDNPGGIEFNGKQYSFYTLKYTPPAVGEDSDGSASLIASSVDQTLITAVRSIDNAKEIMVKVSQLYIENWQPLPDGTQNPDIKMTELQSHSFEVFSASWNATEITFSIGLDLGIMDDTPSGRFSPFNNQGGVI